MKYDFIFDVIRNKDFADYYKSLNLTPYDLEGIITSCFKPLTEKLDLLNHLKNEVEDEYKIDIKNTIEMYEFLIDFYTNSKKYFGENSGVIYLLENVINASNLTNTINQYNVLDTYTDTIGIFNNIDKIKDYAVENNVYYVHMFHINNNILNDNQDVMYICFMHNNKLVPFYGIIYNHDIIKLDENMLYRNMYTSYALSHKGLPYKFGEKVKFKLPGMNNYYHGIIYNESNNNYWNNFMYDLNNFKRGCFIDLSYRYIDGHVTNYAVFDWIEKDVN